MMRQPTMHRPLPRTVVAGIALLTLVGCGGAAEPAADDATAPQEEATEQTPAPEDEQGWCDDLPVTDVQAALGDVVELSGEARAASTGAGCIYGVADAEGDGLSIGEAAGVYEVRLEQAETMDAGVQRPELGAEAILLNHADLTILLDDGREVIVALAAFYVDGPAPEPSALAKAVTTVGELVVQRKG